MIQLIENLGQRLSRLSSLFLTKTSTANLQFDCLDGLRGVAALLVVLSHLSNKGMGLFPFLSLSGVGKYGVFLFFSLSAFLLTLPFLEARIRELHNPRLWLNYGIRRIFRIFPLFTFVLGLSVLLSSNQYFYYKLTPTEFISHVSLQSGKSVFWSIPVEFKYYFVIPVVILVYAFLLRKNLFLSAVVTLTALFLGSWFLWPAETYEINSVSLGPYLPTFLLGSLAALVYYRMSRSSWMSVSWVRPFLNILAWGIALAVFAMTPEIWSRVTGQGLEREVFHKSYLLFGTLWSVFILCVLMGNGLISGILRTRAMRWVGTISFSLYLWHLPVLYLIRSVDFSVSAKPLLTLILALVASAISFLIFEKPFLRIRIAYTRSINEPARIFPSDAKKAA